MSQQPGYANPNLEYEYYTIVPHASEQRLLLLPGNDGWHLPHFVNNEQHLWQEVGHINRTMHRLYHIHTATLRCMAIDYDPTAEVVSRVYALENHNPEWQPPHPGRWVNRQQLAVLPLAVPTRRDVLDQWFAWNAAPISPSRVPWYMPGWFAEARGWIVQQLQHLQITPTSRLEQLRSWQRSAIMRFGTNEGILYFKAVPRIFAHEPRLTQLLALNDPDHFPELLAIDDTRGWFLMRNLGGTTLVQQPEIDQWEAALQTFAQVQIDTVRQVNHLRAIGCPVRPLKELVTGIDPLFADTAATLPGRPAGLSADELGRLRHLAPQLAQMCAGLAAFRIPQALEHGDFWAGQVVTNGERFAFIDWSDSSITHPFFSPLLFLIEIEDYFPKIPNVRNRLRDAYLEPWSIYENPRQLVQAFELAQPLAALHHALTHHQRILPHMEMTWETELMLPFYLKMLLRSTGYGPEVRVA